MRRQITGERRSRTPRSSMSLTLATPPEQPIAITQIAEPFATPKPIRRIKPTSETTNVRPTTSQQLSLQVHDPTGDGDCFFQLVNLFCIFV